MPGSARKPWHAPPLTPWQEAHTNEVPQPLPLERDLFLTFSDLDEEAMKQLAAAATKDDVRRILKECMKIDQDEGFRTEILLDMHFHNYAFCIEQGFSADKTSTMLSVMRIVLEEAVRRRLDLDASFDIFQEWLLRHGVERPPRSVGIFTYDDVKNITSYAHNSFFRHYNLYMYIYMMRCDIDLRLADSDRGATTMPSRPMGLLAEYIVQEPSSLPELSHLFRPTETELAEEELRKTREKYQPEDKQTRIKRQVEEGVQKMMKEFEAQIDEQDNRFLADLAEIEGG